MDSYTVYKTYLALRLHFTTENYDIFAQQGKIRASRKSFLARKDLGALERLGKKYSDAEIVNFLVANFVAGNRWGGVFDAEAHDVYLAWTGRLERLKYLFEQDCQKLSEYSQSWAELMCTAATTHPYIIRAYLGKQVSMETLVILNVLTAGALLDSHIDDDLIWPELRLLILKYTPFLNFTHDQFREIFQQRIRFVRHETAKSGKQSAAGSKPDVSASGPYRGSGPKYQRNTKISYKTGPKPATIKQASVSVALSDYFI